MAIFGLGLAWGSLQIGRATNRISPRAKDCRAAFVKVIEESARKIFASNRGRIAEIGAEKPPPVSAGSQAQEPFSAVSRANSGRTVMSFGIGTDQGLCSLSSPDGNLDGVQKKKNSPRRTAISEAPIFGPGVPSSPCIKIHNEGWWSVQRTVISILANRNSRRALNFRTHLAAGLFSPSHLSFPLDDRPTVRGGGCSASAGARCGWGEVEPPGKH